MKVTFMTELQDWRAEVQSGSATCPNHTAYNEKVKTRTRSLLTTHISALPTVLGFSFKRPSKRLDIYITFKKENIFKESKLTEVTRQSNL